MATESAISRLALTTKMLGHPARLRILAMLRHNKLSVCQIASVLNVAPSTASGYLLELRRADLVTEQRQGKWVYYRLTDRDPNDALQSETRRSSSRIDRCRTGTLGPSFTTSRLILESLDHRAGQWAPRAP